MSAQLALSRREQLEYHEREIERGWVEMGAHYAAIRDKELYRTELGYGTFDDYCRERWRKSAETVRLIMRGAEVFQNLSSAPKIFGALPENVEQARPLASLPPAQQREAWQRAVETAPDGKVTGAHVKRIADEYRAPERLNNPATWWRPSAYEPPSEQSSIIDLTVAATVPAPAEKRSANFITMDEWNRLGELERHELVMRGRNSRNMTMNRQTTDNIEWARWSWNPVTGCKHNCPYCYARDIANRFYEQGFEPAFLPERLAAPYNVRVPDEAADNIGFKNVFTCSMADLFGRWVPQEWIDAVFQTVSDNPQWNFLFLTKFPLRLAEQDWPDNAWIGTSVDSQVRVAAAEKAFSRVQGGIKWLSCEPLMERLTFTSLEMFDWIVIGGATKSTQTEEFQPPWEWIEHLVNQAREAGCKVYFKTNLRTRPLEYPGQ